MENFEFSIDATLVLRPEDMRKIPKSLLDVLQQQSKKDWKLFIVFGSAVAGRST